MLVQELTTKCLRSLLLRISLILFESSEVVLGTLLSDSKIINILCNNNGKHCQFKEKGDTETICLRVKLYEILVLSLNVIERGIFQNVIH